MITGALALLAGGTATTAIRLAGSMIAIQASIGALNDVVDASRDVGHKPRKPIPAGWVTPHEARGIVVLALVVGALLAAPSGGPTLLVAGAGAASGYVYDLRLKGTPFSWVPFAAGIPLLPMFAWLGTTGTIPPWLALLVPLAALSGAALAIANALADRERDLAAGARSLATELGHGRAWLVHAVLHVAVAATALSTLWVFHADARAALGAVVVLLAGVALAARGTPARRELGWEVEAGGAGLLAVAWLAGVTGAVGPGG
ncbi:MAG TPA: UbiA family prenyltransferase [Gemmatimonadales bacterium]|nr:UbiA family prenyltransferase [Gemmatimonadales bacterium]